MMYIDDHDLHQRHLPEETASSYFGFSLKISSLYLLLFGSIGAIGWAIRGTTGWGGIDGMIVPGLTWGLLWCYLCHRRGIDARGVVLWLGLGLSMGGELGYGQYVSWIRGIFYVEDRVISISPFLGYLWFMICGVGKAALGGMVLGWALSDKVSTAIWAVRMLLAGVLFVLLFNLGEGVFGAGVIDWLGAWFAGHSPGLLFPNAGIENYAGTVDKHLGRTIYTNTQNFAVLVWWCAALAVAALQRDRTTLFTGAVIGGGFGLGLSLASVWCLGYGVAPDAWDWWKLWELNAGFYLGLLYAVVLLWATRQVDRRSTAERAMPKSGDASPGREPGATVFLALVGFVLVYAAGYEYFFWTGLLLALFCAGALLWAAWLPASGGTAVAERRRAMMLSLSGFLLVFILLHGASSRAGVLLGFYAGADVDQYAWPPARTALFVPAAALLLCATLIDMRRRLRSSPRDMRKAGCPERMFDLLTFTGAVGAASIWPSKISVVYAVFLGLAVFALARLNRYFDGIDTRP